MGEMPTFIVPQVRATSELVFHHDSAPGERYLAIDGSLLERAPIYIAIRKVADVREDQAEYIDWHMHEVDSLYVLIGNGEGMRGLRGLIRYGEEQRVLESPITVFIPKGVAHSYKLTGGSGTYLSIVLSGDYNGTTHGIVRSEGEEAER
jgi:2-isopropylmalate synthase